MIPRLALLILASTLLASCSSVEEQIVSSLFRNYVSVQEALANDDLPAARQAFQALAEESDPGIKKLAREAADSEDIETARVKFKQLSDVVTEMPLPDGFVVAFCPMADEGKGASWVQPKGEIHNPYLGTEMLNCGEVTKGQ